jgi:dTDP-4-dehydrorhamnose reductase
MVEPRHAPSPLVGPSERPILVVGKGGQLGRALLAHPLLTDPSLAVIGWGRDDLDLGDPASIHEAMERLMPSLVLNAAAWTAVDLAESHADAARRVNAEAPAALATWCAAHEARFVHLSTDFVFDGMHPTPLDEDAPTGPVNVYGTTKRAGEEAVLAAASDALVLRTSWVYAPHGANFVRTILRVLRERGEVRVVADQVGVPTSALGLARAVLEVAVDPSMRGVLHYCDAGVASWYDFAQAIAEEATRLGWFGRVPTVVPIRTVDWPTPAVRPAFSVLDTGRLRARAPHLFAHWRVRLRSCLQALGAEGFDAL